MLFIEKTKYRVEYGDEAWRGLVNLNKVVRQALWKLIEAERSQVRERAEGTDMRRLGLGVSGESWWQQSTWDRGDKAQWGEGDELSEVGVAGMKDGADQRLSNPCFRG